MTDPMLLSPLTIRGLTLKNRAVVSPMCQYSAQDGMANHWHLVHLGKFALGGFGAVLSEATAVAPEGRITHGDLGLWSDAHAEALKPVIAFIRENGAAAGLQLGHAGRKASMQRPWRGNGPLTQADAELGDLAWPVIGASAIPMDDGWLMPREMTLQDIEALKANFVAAARRADAIGCDFIEIHGAHGYLIATFLAPSANLRTDAYGGDRDGRMRLALETVEAVREVWPAEKPLFFRMSSVDGVEGGWSVHDSVVLAKALKARGVDVIDCSAGGAKGKAGGANPQLVPRGNLLPYSEQIRAGADVMTQTVGMILDGPQAEAALQAGKADLIAIGREALYDPFWVHHQADAMGAGDFSRWPEQYGWWLERREPSVKAIREAEAQER